MANVSKIKLLGTTYDVKDNSGSKSTHTHTKDQITDFPVIPAKDSDLTNDRYVRYDINSQGLNTTQKANARTNIGAGTSSFSGSYTDLTNKPTIPTYTSQLTNDSEFVTETWVGNNYLLKTDIYDWAKASTKPSYSASEISGVLPPVNNARSNLGDPTVYETGIIDSEFTNKTMAYSPDYVKIYRSSDGSTLTEATEYTNTHKKALLIGDDQTSLSIPVNTYLVIEITSMTYVYLNMLYTYNSTSGTRFEYRIDVSYNKSSWSTWVNYGSQQSTWPGHTVLRHNTIPFMQGGTQGTHYAAVRVWIKCVKVSDSYTTGYLYKLQWWGGYPTGRRTYYSVDSSQNHTFPAGVLASTFYENGTALSSKYLGISAKAADSDKLDNHDSSYFATATHTHQDYEDRITALETALDGLLARLTAI